MSPKDSRAGQPARRLDAEDEAARDLGNIALSVPGSAPVCQAGAPVGSSSVIHGPHDAPSMGPSAPASPGAEELGHRVDVLVAEAVGAGPKGPANRKRIRVLRALRLASDHDPPSGYTVHMRSDTSTEVDRRQRDRIRRMTPAQRVAEGARLCKSARRVMRDGIRHRHPGYSDDEVEMALARLLWGDDLYRAARPDWPLLDP